MVNQHHVLAPLGSYGCAHHAGRTGADYCYIKLFCHGMRRFPLITKGVIVNAARSAQELTSEIAQRAMPRSVRGWLQGGQADQVINQRYVGRYNRAQVLKRYQFRVARPGANQEYLALLPMLLTFTCL